MGLDMYLNKKKHVGWNYEHVREELGAELPDLSHFGIDVNKVSVIEEQAMYWRKANAIHKWFVDNVQKGVDDCGEYYVSLEQLEELLQAVHMELEIKDNDELGTPGSYLPPQEGFFFGTYGLDDWYYANLEETYKVLKQIINKGDERFVSYYYQSSW
jgi:hypothetical protein